MFRFITRKDSFNKDKQKQTKAELLARIDKDDDPLFTEYVYDSWIKADKNGSGTLNKHELKSLLKKINLEFKDSDFEAFFKKVDADNSGKLDFVEFRNCLRDLRERKEIFALFSKYSKSKNFLSKEDFVEFLTKEQKEKPTADAITKIFSLLPLVDKSKIGFVAFSSFIASRENSLYNPEHTLRTYQDMKQPLPHYFIASSHNTYLTGHQLQGESSPHQYKYCLEAGCRCVELDCWDGEDGEPIITHGHTITSKIKFEDVIKVIGESSFVNSEYPVILSLENHCSEPQQIKMAKILKRYLGDLLPKPFTGKQLPTPHELRRKIIIKGKKLKKDGADEVSAEEESDLEEEEEIVDTVKGKIKEGSSSLKKTDDKIERGLKKSDEIEKSGKKPAKAKHSLAKELSDITHLNSARFGGFEKDKDLNPWDMCSNSETKVKSFYKHHQQADMIKHNQNFLTRTYPKGTRFDSSNYSPIEAWGLGCHMVALNYQTGDHSMYVNNGKFLDNGRCGYLLKPSAILGVDKNEETLSVIIKIISGWQLPKVSGTTKGEVIDPFVRVAIVGVEADSVHHKTKVIQNNGYNPVWEEDIKFVVTNADLAHLLIEVYDEDKLSKNDFIAYSSLPVSSLREGYRSVILYSAESKQLQEASLLVHIAVEKTEGFVKSFSAKDV